AAALRRTPMNASVAVRTALLPHANRLMSEGVSAPEAWRRVLSEAGVADPVPAGALSRGVRTAGELAEDVRALMAERPGQPTYAGALQRAAATPAPSMGELPSSTRLDQEVKQLRAQHYRDTGERLSFREAARQVGDRYAAERRQVQLGQFAETRQRISDG